MNPEITNEYNVLVANIEKLKSNIKTLEEIIQTKTTENPKGGKKNLKRKKSKTHKNLIHA